MRRRQRQPVFRRRGSATYASRAGRRWRWRRSSRSSTAGSVRGRCPAIIWTGVIRRLKTSVPEADIGQALHATMSAVSTPIAAADPGSSEGAIASRRMSPPKTATRRVARVRLLVVSHPAVVSVNQEVYRELARRGWETTIVLPSRWRHEFAGDSCAPQRARRAGGGAAVRRVSPSRDVRNATSTSQAVVACAPGARPDVAFVEAEPFSLAAAQWGIALDQAAASRSGCSATRTSTARCPLRSRWLRSRVLRDAAFVAARSDSAGAARRARGAPGARSCSPRRPCPAGTERARRRAQRRRSPSATPAGWSRARDCPTCSRAVRELAAPVELLLIGDGELRARARGAADPRLAGSRARRPDATSRWPPGYAQLDVLVLPSHTTPTWKEQFGRVIVEALWCGVPVVGSDSGEIPWLIGLDRRRADLPRGRQPSALAAPAGRASRGPGAAAAAGRDAAGRPSSGCSRCRPRPTRSSTCSTAAIASRKRPRRKPLARSRRPDRRSGRDA